MVRTTAVYPLAALAEIAGCFAFSAWLRLDKSPLWLFPGLLCLAAFAYLLTLVDSSAAGRAYAAYGGVYMAASTWRLRSAGSGRPNGPRRTGLISLARPCASSGPGSFCSGDAQR